MGTLRCLRKLLAAKTFYGCEGDITFFRRNFAGSYYRNFSLRTLRCFNNFLAAAKFYGCEGGHNVFPSKFYCRRLPKTFIGNNSVLQKRPGCEKLVWIREGGIIFFRRKVFVLQYLKILLGTLWFFRNFLVWKEIYGQDGVIASFRHFWCLILLKNFFGNSSVFQQKFLVARILHGSERGISPFSVEIFLHHSFAIFLWAPFVV